MTENKHGGADTSDDETEWMKAHIRRGERFNQDKRKVTQGKPVGRKGGRQVNSQPYDQGKSHYAAKIAR